MSYPVSLDLRGKSCVVVGGGAVAARKVDGLLQADARVLVVAPGLCEGLREHAASGRIQWLRQRWTAGMHTACRPTLVFAATDDAAVNQAVASEARLQGALVNVADDSAAGDFSNMATMRRPPLMVALDSGGASPALVTWLRDRIASCVSEEHATLARWLGEIRPQIRASIPQQERRRRFYNDVLESDVLDLLASNQVDEARNLLQGMVRKGS